MKNNVEELAAVDAATSPEERMDWAALLSSPLCCHSEELSTFTLRLIKQLAATEELLDAARAHTEKAESRLKQAGFEANKEISAIHAHARKTEKELERLRLDYGILKVNTYDQAHSAGANLGYDNCRSEMKPLLSKAEAERDWLAEKVVDALGKTSQGKYLAPPTGWGFPVCHDKETAVKAWLSASQEATKRGEAIS